MKAQSSKLEGDIGIFGFMVLVIFEIGLSVFALKCPVSRFFYPFWFSVSYFLNI